MSGQEISNLGQHNVKYTLAKGEKYFDPTLRDLFLFHDWGRSFEPRLCERQEGNEDRKREKCGWPSAISDYIFCSLES